MSEQKLWAMHVPGPDDVFAMTSEAAAHAAVARHNKAVNEIGLAERFGMTQEQISARVIDWPNSAESHAKGLVESMRERVIESMQLDGDYRISTYRIARRMGAKTACVRRELLRMEQAGLVCREATSAVNNTIWRLLTLPPNAGIKRRRSRPLE